MDWLKLLGWDKSMFGMEKMIISANAFYNKAGTVKLSHLIATTQGFSHECAQYSRGFSNCSRKNGADALDISAVLAGFDGGTMWGHHIIARGINQAFLTHQPSLDAITGH
jgi:hypothetical protein